MELKELIEILDDGGYSCVIANGVHTRHFRQRGVDDLYRLVIEQPELLLGATVVDKVIGKGAAALMVAGGVSRVWTHVISDGALALLSAHGVEVGYEQQVEHIINRKGDGWCPLEWRCRATMELAEILDIIYKFKTENDAKH